MHVVGTAGHVDHGKSTLVRALTGIDPDRFSEEKRRGLTIDLGFAWCTLPSGREIGIVDVPGHERFIRNMLAGVGSIDGAIFVVAADEGWMPQSAEHLQILDFLDVGRGVVALTKTDLVDADHRALVTEEVGRQLQGTVLADAPIVGVSAINDAGLDDLLGALDEQLTISQGAPQESRPRLFVDRSFTITGAGTVVTGTLTGGRLRVGDEVAILPEGRRARIRSLQTHRAEVKEAAPPSRVAANLVGLDRREVRRGDALVTDEWVLTDRFAARVRAGRDLGRMLLTRGAYELYAGSAQTPCRIKFLEGEGITPAATGLVEIFCDAQLPLIPGDRFVIRDVGRWETVGGGVVLDQAPPRLRRGDEEAIGRLRAREDLRGASLVARIVAERRAIALSELAALSGYDVDVTMDAVAQDVKITATHALLAGHADVLRRQASERIRAHHTSQPLDAGMPIEALRSALDVDQTLFEQLLEDWHRSGQLVREGAVVRMPEHGGVPAQRRPEADDALGRLRAAGVSPPSVHELGLPVELAKALERHGELVFVNNDIAYAADVWAAIEQKVVDLISSSGPATVAQVRDSVGTSRKYAVPLLEHLDATGVTRRNGDVRELGPRGRDLARRSP